MKKIYLDYAAATPLASEVLDAMRPYFSEHFYNPSALYLSAQAVRRDLENARHSLAKQLGAKPAEIIFTSGATEANNLALFGVMADQPKSELIVSSIEHDSVLVPAKMLKARLAPVDKNGLVKLEAMEKLINDRTRLISVIMVSNELGTLQPISKIAELVKAARADRLRRGIDQPIYLHSDATQAANYFELNVSRQGVDLLSINGGKIYGPKQTGVLYLKAGTILEPRIVGGGQEFGLRSGTENVAGAIGLTKALELAQAQRKAEAQRVAKLRQNFIVDLSSALNNAQINGHPKKTAPHIVNVHLPGCDAERVMMELDEQGIVVAVGSACSAAYEEPSHVLRAIGLSDRESRACLRFSFGRQTTEADIITTINILAQIIQN